MFICHPQKIKGWPLADGEKINLNKSKLLPRISETFCLGAGVSGASSLVPDSSSPRNVGTARRQKGCQGHPEKNPKAKKRCGKRWAGKCLSETTNLESDIVKKCIFDTP